MSANHDKRRTDGQFVGYISIDSGLLYVGDPGYVVGEALGKMDWGTFLREYFSREPVRGARRIELSEQPPAASAPYFPDGELGLVFHLPGDGSYPVYADIDDDGHVRSVTVHFGEWEANAGDVAPVMKSLEKKGLTNASANAASKSFGRHRCGIASCSRGGAE